MRFLILAILVLSLIIYAEGQNGGRTLVLQEQKIEGKLKKPQVAVISLGKRPVFKSIALSDLNSKKSILDNIDKSIFENRVYMKPFNVRKEN